MVVDEEIYRRPPSMLIATVDKFAQMAWQGSVQTLFGQVTRLVPAPRFRSPELEDTNSHQAAGSIPRDRDASPCLLRPPDLIIQDELHLISGPLGSLVGIYEGAVDQLATWEVDGEEGAAQGRSPRQLRCGARRHRCPALFNRRVTRVPASGAGGRRELLFAGTARKRRGAPGRLYVGICAPGRQLKASLIRVYVAVLGAGQTLYRKVR